MSFRFNTAAGFLAAASLLSGSAFAFAPEFNGDLPSVIITDRLAAPSTEYDRTTTGVGTQGIFRYTGAFDLFDYIDLRGNDPADVKMVFTEHLVDETTLVINPAPVNSPKILLINGQFAVSTVPTTAADFASAPALDARPALDFFNTDFSGNDENTITDTFDYIGDKTGHDLSASPVQTRAVTMYLSGSPSTEVSGPSSFYVFTTTEGSDEISNVNSNIWSTVIETSNNFQGWDTFRLGLLAVIPTTGNYATVKAWNTPTAEAPAENPPYNGLGTTATDTATGFTFSPNVSWTPATFASGTAPAGTTQVSVSINGTKFGYGGWQRPAANILSANKLYRLRSRVSSANDASRDEWRVRFGDEQTVGQSSFQQIVLDGGLGTGVNANRLSTTPQDFYSYLLTKGTGTANSARVFYEVIGNPTILATANEGQDLTVHEYELSATDRSSLTGENVLKNLGGTFAAAAGEVAPIPASPTPFTATGANGLDIFGINDTSSTPVAGQQPLSSAIGAGGATFDINIGPQTVSDTRGRVWFLRTVPAAGSTVNSFTASEGKLYILDAWLSSAGAATGPFPQLRLVLQFGNQADYGIYELFAGSPALDIATTAKAYHVVAEPQFVDPATTSATGTFSLDLTSARDETDVYNANKTITINRLVLTEYNAGR